MGEELRVLDCANHASGKYGFLENLEGFEGDLHASEPFDRTSVGAPTAMLKDKDDGAQTLPDAVGNHDGALIVSPRLKAFLAEHVEDLEFLPLKILDRGGQVVSDAYELAHLTHHLDCIDMAAAQPSWSWDKKEIERMDDRKLPLLMDRIPTGRVLFHPERFASLRLIRPAFAERVLAAKFTNLAVESIEHALAYM